MVLCRGLPPCGMWDDRTPKCLSRDIYRLFLFFPLLFFPLVTVRTVFFRSPNPKVITGKGRLEKAFPSLDGVRMEAPPDSGLSLECNMENYMAL